MDEETGLYYYGARYYDSKMSLFLSVDPLVESTMDPYGYCYQNPVKYIDPTGMSGESTEDWYKNKKTGEYKWFDTKPEEGAVIIGGYSYVGASYDDIRKDWEANTTAIERIFSNPNIDASGWAGEIGAFNKDNLSLKSKWSNSDSFVGKFSYDIANGYYIAAQVVDFDLLGKDYENPLTGQRAYTNLDGTPQYDSGERALEFVTSAIPYLAEVKILTGGKVLNASQFSKRFKGTFITEGSAQSRGQKNRIYNSGVRLYNKYVVPSNLNSSGTLIDATIGVSEELQIKK